MGNPAPPPAPREVSGTPQKDPGAGQRYQGVTAPAGRSPPAEICLLERRDLWPHYSERNYSEGENVLYITYIPS